MNNWLIALGMVIGPASMIFGIILNEHFRKKDKKLLFSEKYLEKKVNLYEKLYNSLVGVSRKWSDLLPENPNEKTIRKELLKPCSKIHDFLFKNLFYVNETIAMNILIVFIEILDYPQMDSKKQKIYIKNYSKSWNQILEAILEDSGFLRLDQELKSLGSKNTHLKTLGEYSDKYEENWYLKN